MKLDFKKYCNKNVLQEFHWDLLLHFKEDNIKSYTNEEEINELKKVGQYVTRCKIESEKDSKCMYVDYLLPTKENTFLAKGINQFVTSTLIDTIQLNAYNSAHNIEFSYICPIKEQLPDWYITFGTKFDCLTLTVKYELLDIKIA